MFSGVAEQTLFAFLLITVRLAPMGMLMPVFSERSVPRRIRVAFALTFALMLAPVLTNLPSIPSNPYNLFGLAVMEIMIGSLLALTTRMLMTSTHVAGTIIAFQTGLAAAQTFDPAQGGQSAIISTFMTIVATTLIVAMDLHHIMIRAMVHSYQMFPVGEPIMITDFTRVIIYYVSASFQLGAQLSAPFLVYGVIYNTGLGLIARMVPKIQVFFVGMPINIYLGFILFMTLLPSMMLLFVDQYRDLLESFLG